MDSHILVLILETLFREKFIILQPPIGN